MLSCSFQYRAFFFASCSAGSEARAAAVAVGEWADPALAEDRGAEAASVGAVAEVEDSAALAEDRLAGAARVEVGEIYAMRSGV